MKKLVYTACNPVAAGLVAKATQWPGLIAFLSGQTLKANRPDVFFRKDGDMEENVEIILTTPLQFSRLNEQGGLSRSASAEAVTVRTPGLPEGIYLE